MIRLCYVAQATAVLQFEQTIRGEETETGQKVGR